MYSLLCAREECYIQGPRDYHLDDTFGIPGSECNMDSAGGARIKAKERARACSAVRSKLRARVVGWPK